MTCAHDWAPVPNECARYACANCGRHGVRDIKTARITLAPKKSPRPPPQFRSGGHRMSDSDGNGAFTFHREYAKILGYWSGIPGAEQRKDG